MKKALLLALALCIATPALAAQDDTTTTLMQGLQSLGMGGMGGTGTSAGTTPATGLPSLDQMKTAALARASLAAIDTDHNGTVSKPELAALTNKLFDVADTDHNGQLSEQELTTFAANMNRMLAFLQ